MPRRGGIQVTEIILYILQGLNTVLIAKMVFVATVYFEGSLEFYDWFDAQYIK